MKSLRQGSKGAEVKAWQYFLRGQGLYLGEVDGAFGPASARASSEFQRTQGLTPDGIVGLLTLGRAMQLGFDPLERDTTDLREEGPNFPAPLAGLKPASFAQRIKLFGQFEFEPAPTPGNREGIKILGSWQKDNIVSVTVPELRGVEGAGSTGKVLFHSRGAAQLLSLFAAWADAGLLPLVKTWAGSFAPRFIRGSTVTLSNHAWATAFDVNVAWNPLGAQPALLHKIGSVRALVPLANAHGFYWGGHFQTRPDGMHFELSRLL